MPIKEELFGPEEDSKSEIRFVDNVIYDITNDIFHLDYLMAAVTAAMWLRCCILLRLTETFGPLLSMIVKMFIIFIQFFIIYALGIVVFSSVATLTLSSNPNFANLFEAARTYIGGSLGAFDLNQYDDMVSWQMYYGILMHLSVLFFNMILLINLLIAIMSDAYAYLSEVKTGIFWAKVITEMPKHGYDKHYGALTMFPFFFSWLSFLVMPIFIFVKDLGTLKKINDVCFLFVYFPIGIFCLLVFIIVNLILLPIAFIKTIVHKAILLYRFRTMNQIKNLLVFIAIGIPLLVLAQFPDAVRFFIHTFSNKAGKQENKNYSKRIEFKDFV